ncbi:MAG: signal peptidase I [Candidatus Omnitrophota bacterium]
MMAAKRVEKNKKEKIEQKEIEGGKSGEKVSAFREYTQMIIEVLVLVFFINAFLLQSQTIPTGSMEDTMLVGDHLLVDKSAYAPYLGTWDKNFLPRLDIKRGMIITFKAPPEMDKDYVKRVIACPGETIRIKDKKVFINGKPLDEPYAVFKGEMPTDGDNYPLDQPRMIDPLGTMTYLPIYIMNEYGGIDTPRTVEFCERFKNNVIMDESGNRVFNVPDGYYFCMGDNRDNSYDCRFWGPVPERNILGKPWRIYWSYESSTGEYLTPGIAHKIKDLALTVVHFFTKTRWDRMFKKFS